MATAADTVTVNKQLAVRWLELISAGAVDELCAITPADSTMEGGPPDLPRGPAGIRAPLRHLRRDHQTWQVHDVIAEEDRVAVRATNRCLQDSFLGVPAAGIEQVFTATFVFQILDGQVHRIWRNAADLQRLLQLGVRIQPPA